MAYTNVPWTNSVPLGSEAANLADDYLRRLRLDVQERMDDIVEDWINDDPVAVLTRDKYIHWQAGCANRGTGASIIGDYDSPVGIVGAYVNPYAASQDLYWRMALPLPPGAELTEVIAMMGKGNAGDTVQYQVSRMDTAGALASVATGSAGVADPTEVSSGALTHTILADEYYFMSVYLRAAAVATSPKFYGVRLLYTLDFALQGF